MPISSFSNDCFSVKHFGGFCLSFVYLRFGCLSVKKSSFFGLIDNCLSYKYPSASQSLHILCNTYRKVKARFLIVEPVFSSSIKRPLTAGANRELRSIFVTLCKVDKCGGERYGRTSLQKNRQKLGARHTERGWLPACKHVMESKVASKAAESGRQNTDARKSITS